MTAFLRLGSANAYDTALRNITERQSALANLQENLTAGKRVLRASDDPTAAADAYVARISALGGQVSSRTDVTEGGTNTPATMMGSDAMMPMPYPSGPGVWLSVEVPAGRFDEALAAARETGQTIRLEQSAQDVSATVADIDARVRALRSSVAQLRSLMDEVFGSENFVNQIVVALFSDLDNAALTLKSSLETLKANPNQANLDAAKAAWVAARIPWEQSEAALFGPADIFGIDPAIDSWPLSEGDLQRVLDNLEYNDPDSYGAHRPVIHLGIYAVRG